MFQHRMHTFRFSSLVTTIYPLEIWLLAQAAYLGKFGYLYLKRGKFRLSHMFSYPLSFRSRVKISWKEMLLDKLSKISNNSQF